MKESISVKRLVLALCCAAVTAWFLVSAPMLWSLLREDGPSMFLGGLVLFAIYGLPTALFVTLTVGIPVGLVARSRGCTSLTHALAAGLAAGALIWATMLGWKLLTSTGTWGGSQGNVWEDGWPTALGWRQELMAGPATAMIGAISALVARCVALGRLRN